MEYFIISADAPLLILKGPEKQEALEQCSASFICHLSRTAKSVTWTKDGCSLQPSNKYEMAIEGDQAKLIICDLKLGDSGIYCCDTGDDKSSATLTVRGNYISRGCAASL